MILVVLESLAAVEETLVREKAAESITKVCDSLVESQIQEYYLPLLKRLSTGEWFTSRTSATALYAAAYPKASTAIKEEMRKMFTHLCTDDTPMVRRAAAKELGPFSKTLAHDVLLSELLPAFRKLASDDQDSVRLLTVDALIAIAEALSDEECKTYLGATMKAMVGDKSWRVRYMVADHFVLLAAAAGQDIVREELVVAFVALLKDNEAEVRTAAAGQIPGKPLDLFVGRRASLSPSLELTRRSSLQASRNSSTAKSSSPDSCLAFGTSQPTRLSTFVPLSELKFQDSPPSSERTRPSNISFLSSSNSSRTSSLM